MMKETGKWLDDVGPRTRAIRSGIRRTPKASARNRSLPPPASSLIRPRTPPQSLLAKSMGMGIPAPPIRPSGLLRSDCVQRGAAGISEGLVRIAVGLEDLQSDCLRGLETLTRWASAATFRRPYSASRLLQFREISQTHGGAQATSSIIVAAIRSPSSASFWKATT